MYGDKETPRLRRLAIVQLVRRHPGIKQVEIALGVHRAMVCKDLPKLEKAGVRLYQDDRRGLYVAGGSGD